MWRELSASVFGWRGSTGFAGWRWRGCAAKGNRLSLACSWGVLPDRRCDGNLPLFPVQRSRIRKMSHDCNNPVTRLSHGESQLNPDVSNVIPQAVELLLAPIHAEAATNRGKMKLPKCEI